MVDNDGLIRAIEERQAQEEFTLAEMAEKLGISTAYLCMIYQGQRKPSRKFFKGVLNAYPELQAEVARFLSQ